MREIYQWHVLELEFHASEVYQNPYMDVVLQVSFTSPEGKPMKVPGFWDGGDSWKVRFAPPHIGRWEWESEACGLDDSGLHGKKGSFTVEEYSGNNPIYKHGFIKVNENGRGFEHVDGTPFFWLGDTIWTATSRATVEEWKHYTEFRGQQGFNIAQINSLPQHDASGEDFRVPFEEGKIVWNLQKINPEYFQYMDKLMYLTHAAGMFTAAVALWCDYVPGANPSWSIDKKADFTPELAARYGRYMAARYAAFGTIWIITGDSDFENTYSMSVYDAAAEAIQSGSPFPTLITAHLNGGLYTPKALNTRNWLDFHMIQSSHNSESDKVAIFYAKMDRSLFPVRPVLNGEPPYEQIGYYMKPQRIDRDFVRKVGWVSILAGGNAGITYGAHGLWSWHRDGEAFKPAAAWMMPDDWKTALEFEGAEDYARMKGFFEKLPWWELESVENLIIGQDNCYAVTAANNGMDAIVVYLKGCRQLLLKVNNSKAYTVMGFNPKEDLNLELEITYDDRDSITIESLTETEFVLLLQKNK